MSDDLRAGRALDAACARLLGWEDVAIRYISSALGGYDDMTGYSAERIAAHEKYLGEQIIPHYSTRRKHARLLEDEIERRGLSVRYVEELTEVVIRPSSLYAPWTKADIWWLIRATPEQRARAFLEAMKGAETNAKE